ncbi:mucin-2 [Condylostylus longicornis]|uniref:mucin-2 n=1 Tax=Condylostylus longicornis TaxID=2530218 RepID=UPI00244E0E87|nr:mucin-2 [Condylostylus longicornis]XP_055383520.1 mucin-2 [Condylostylus longicornis]
MVGKDIDPSEIGKHPSIIKAAQREMTQSDVLVCGKCHSVFHFIDLFIEHKENDENCSKESNLKDCRETKPKVWAFLLWKSAQLSNTKNQNDSSHMNSWQLYQTWVKMEESVRETWVVAGKTIQSFNRVGQGTLQEMPVKITKTVIDTAPTNKSLATAGNRFNPVANRVIKKEDGIVKRDDVTTDEEFSPTDRQRIIKNQTNTNLVQKTSPVVIKPNQTSRRAKRTIPNSSSTEFETVEKIVAKRFNPRRKMHEYLVKWEGYPHDQNSWEPQSHLDTCPQLLETFEKQLARQKEQRAAQERARLQQQQANSINSAATSTPIPNAKKITENSIDKPLSTVTATSNASPLSPQARLNRATLKVKSDDDKQLDSHEVSADHTGSIPSIKRKLDDSDFNANTTGEEDFEEDAIPVHAVKRLKNGTTITTSTGKPENKLSPQISKTVNGAVKSPTSTDNSADVVIIKESNSGIVRKVTPNSTNSSPSQKGEASVRILSRGETASSGIIRLSGSTPNLTAVGTNSTTNTSNIRNPVQQRLIQKSNSVANINQTTRTGSPQINRPTLVGQRSTAQTVRPVTTPQRPQILRSTTTSTPRQLQSQAKTTTIYRPSLSPGNAISNTPQSGRMVINRSVRQTQVNKPVTPEEKILQLSKSGDLKITRKTIPTSQDHQMKAPLGQNRMIQNRSSHLSQQRTQMISSKPGLQTLPTKLSIAAKSPSPSPPGGGLTLCPITGKILTESGEEVPPPTPTPEKKDESGVVTTQMQFANEQEALAAEGTTITLGEGQQILTNEDGTPLLVSGEDGTIYQVAGKNAEGQTILIAQGADGEQQFAYVAAEDNDGENGAATGVLTLDNAVAEAVANMLPEQQNESLSNATAGNTNETQYVIKQEDGTVVTATAAQVAESEAAANAAAVAAASGGQLTIDTNQALTIQTGAGDSDSQDANIPAEVVQADLPSPGGTRRVILLLQDGTFMMTEMHDDEYQALNIT